MTGADVVWMDVGLGHDAEGGERKVGAKWEEVKKVKGRTQRRSARRKQWCRN